MEAVEELSRHVGVLQACEALGVVRSHFYRKHRAQESNSIPSASTPKPHPRALPEALKKEVRDVLNSERFSDQSPRQVYATLLDEDQDVPV